MVCATEVLHQVRKTKKKRILFKLDFEKAYDLVNWKFLQEVLGRRGSGDTFTRWIANTLEGSRLY